MSLPAAVPAIFEPFLCHHPYPFCRLTQLLSTPLFMGPVTCGQPHPFVPSCRQCLISQHHWRGEYSTISYSERPHSRNFYYSNCAVLFIIVVYLLLCQIYKPNPMIGVYVCVGENIVYLAFNTIHGFRHALGCWNTSPAVKGG